MKRKTAALAAAIVPLLAASSASAQTTVSYPNTKAAVTYSAFWHKAHEKCGRCAGRNIRRWGVRHTTGRVERATFTQVARSTGQLQRLTAPPPPPRHLLRRVAVQPSLRPAGVSSSTVRAGLPDCTWRPESGGNYGAYNSSSGAYGKYQIIPSTWAAHCSGVSRDPAGQEVCAARVYQAQGAGAWVNC